MADRSARMKISVFESPIEGKPWGELTKSFVPYEAVNALAGWGELTKGKYDQ